MYVRWPSIRGVALVVAGLALIAWSFVGNWFAVEWMELFRYVAGVVGILLLIVSYWEFEEAHNRRVWVESQDR